MYVLLDNNYSVVLRFMVFDSMFLFVIFLNFWIKCLNKIDENWYLYM